jgi:phosphatidylserine/phosphatidylglycerophosphate/cardiolipin synthase-like enzyme
MYHCKTMVVHNVRVTVGSANFDNRSLTIDDEVTLTALDPAVAAEADVYKDHRPSRRVVPFPVLNESRRSKRSSDLHLRSSGKVFGRRADVSP